MQDALKLAEEALEALRPRGKTNRVDLMQQAGEALTAIRAARAEWGWRPIAEMAEIELEPVRIGYYGPLSWVVASYSVQRPTEVVSKYTHFYRPQLPPPPTRLEVGNG